MSRSNWKPIYVSPEILLLKNRILQKNVELKVFSRSSTITMDDIDLTFKVYNGIRFIPILIKKDMIGRKLGEFVPTRKRPNHKEKKTVLRK